MDEQDQAQQALMQMFRRDRAEVAAHPPRPPRLRDSSRALAWLIGIAAVIFVIFPTAFIVIYPRFGPVDTMTSFCQAEADGDYASAYALLSQRAQQAESLAVFTQASSASSLVSCSASGGIPFIFGGTRATLDVRYAFDLNGAGSTLDGTMSFVHESGGWRVDSTAPEIFQVEP